MRLEHHLVGGYVRYISPHIIIIINVGESAFYGHVMSMSWEKAWKSIHNFYSKHYEQKVAIWKRFEIRFVRLILTFSLKWQKIFPEDLYHH